MVNKNRDFILTEFYYPAISKTVSSKNEGNIKTISSLRPQLSVLQNKLEKIFKVQKLNFIERLDGTNKIYLLLKKDQINQLYDLSDKEILDLILNNDSFLTFFNMGKESMERPKKDFFLHTKDMYMDDHKKRSSKLLKTKNYIYPTKNLSSPYPLNRKKYKEYLIKKREIFIDSIITSCSIKRKAQSIELDCAPYPLQILNQNIEINFFY
jgi:hypothetical protein